MKRRLLLLNICLLPLPSITMLRLKQVKTPAKKMCTNKNSGRLLTTPLSKQKTMPSLNKPINNVLPFKAPSVQKMFHENGMVMHNSDQQYTENGFGLAGTLFGLGLFGSYLYNYQKDQKQFDIIQDMEERGWKILGDAYGEYELETNGNPTKWNDQIKGALLKLSSEQNKKKNELKDLIKTDANINATSDYFGKSTPLIKASFACLPEVVQMYIDAGADLNIKNDLTGNTALTGSLHQILFNLESFREGTKDYQSLKLSNTVPPIGYYSKNIDDRLVRQLIIIKKAEANAHQIVLSLIQGGADTSLANNEGYTALSLAEKLDELHPGVWSDVVKLLKKA